MEEAAQAEGEAEMAAHEEGPSALGDGTAQPFAHGETVISVNDHQELLTGPDTEEQALHLRHRAMMLFYEGRLRAPRLWEDLCSRLLATGCPLCEISRRGQYSGSRVVGSFVNWSNATKHLREKHRMVDARAAVAASPPHRSPQPNRLQSLRDSFALLGA